MLGKGAIQNFDLMYDELKREQETERRARLSSIKFASKEDKAAYMAEKQRMIDLSNKMNPNVSGPDDGHRIFKELPFTEADVMRLGGGSEYSSESNYRVESADFF